MTKWWEGAGVLNKNLIWANWAKIPSEWKSLFSQRKEISTFNSVSSWCCDMWHWRTWYDTDSGSLVIEAVVRFCIVVSSLLALNRNISLRVPGDWWQQGSWSDDNMTKPRKSLPRTWCCLAPSSSLSSQFCLYFVSSYLATQYLGRILSWPAPFSNVDAQIISLTHSKHSILNTPEWTHSSNIKKVLPAIFYPLMPWWDELPSVSNFLPPPDTKLCEYRPELVIISIIFSLLFFIQEGLLPHFTKENHPVLDLRSADKVYFSNLHCYKVEILLWIEINPRLDFKASSNESLSAPLFLSLVLFPAA